MENILRIQFKGRLRRNRFWPTIIAVAVIIRILEAIATNLADSNLADPSLVSPILMIVIGGLLVLLELYLILVGLGLGARRLHDTGRSAWWLLIGIVPIVGWITLIVFYCLDSKPGSNQWGPNPKELA